MPAISFMVYTDDEPEPIASGKVKVVPRVGEKVCLSGKAFGDTSSDTSTVFVVDDVFHRYDCGDTTCCVEDAEVEVYLYKEAASGFVPKCLCSVPEKSDIREGRCSGCGGRYLYRGSPHYKVETAASERE